jgi:hypothetical protein
MVEYLSSRPTIITSHLLFFCFPLYPSHLTPRIFLHRASVGVKISVILFSFFLSLFRFSLLALYSSLSFVSFPSPDNHLCLSNPDLKLFFYHHI